jgi:hypothetical protein
VIESKRAETTGMAEAPWHVGAAVFCPGRERDQYRQAAELLEGQIMQALALDQRDARALLAALLPADPAAA